MRLMTWRALSMSPYPAVAGGARAVRRGGGGAGSAGAGGRGRSVIILPATSQDAV
jgi:hypothetical protein